MKPGLIVAIVFTCLGLALVIGAAAYTRFDFSNIGAQKTESVSYDIDGEFTSVEIDTELADVTLLKSEDGACRLVCDESEKLKYKTEISDGVLRITQNDGRVFFERWGTWGEKLTATLYLPGDDYDSLKIDAGTGDVSVPGNFFFGSAEITVSTGDLDFAASVSGGVTLKSSTGEINVGSVKAGSVKISLSTGRLSVGAVECDGDITVDGSTGSKSFEGTRCAGFSVTGSTGRIELKDVVASSSIEIRNSTGSVRLEKSDSPDINVKTTTGSVSGTLLTPKTFNTRTSTGSVRVPESSSGGKCSVETTTGSIRIEIAE